MPAIYFISLLVLLILPCGSENKRQRKEDVAEAANFGEDCNLINKICSDSSLVCDPWTKTCRKKVTNSCTSNNECVHSAICFGLSSPKTCTCPVNTLENSDATGCASHDDLT